MQELFDILLVRVDISYAKISVKRLPTAPCERWEWREHSHDFTILIGLQKQKDSDIFAQQNPILDFVHRFLRGQLAFWNPQMGSKSNWSSWY